MTVPPIWALAWIAKLGGWGQKVQREGFPICGCASPATPQSFLPRSFVKELSQKNLELACACSVRAQGTGVCTILKPHARHPESHNSRSGKASPITATPSLNPDVGLRGHDRQEE
jgi:hypothetical protein